MSPLPSSIQQFLVKNRVATVCFGNDASLHAINCFYSYDEEQRLLVFKSSEGSGHDHLVYLDAGVAGTILPDMITLSALRGLQFRGRTVKQADLDQERMASLYCGKFSFSRFLDGYYWGVKLLYVKFTDNRVKFGHKIEWHSQPA